MIGICSRSAGVLLLPQPGTDEYAVFDVAAGEKRDPVEAQYRYAAVQDWEDIEGADADALLDASVREYWLARAVSLLRLSIGGLDGSLAKRVFEHVEEILVSRASSEQVLSRLLVAPLADPRSPIAPSKSALSYGFSAVASILDELRDLQPLVHRLTDIWLGLPETAFSHFSESREMIWVTVVEKVGVKQLLKARSRKELADRWKLLFFHVSTPQSRSGVGILGQELSRRLFPQESEEEKPTTPVAADVELPSEHLGPAMSGHEEFVNAQKQIAAIENAVSEGQDAKAEKFLRELIQRQTSFPAGEIYAVKSLCNIAQRCADMFRMDFEWSCLQQAMRLAPSDGWTLIQYGDHLKRVGNYEEAIRAFGEAERLGESVGRSCVADVFSQQGDYEKAIGAYQAIPNFQQTPEILTAIADNLRKMGRMGEAEAAYAELLRLGQQGAPSFAAAAVRARAGIAEIAKRRGHLEDALQIYRELVELPDIDDRDLLVHKLALCNILKLSGQFDAAYRIIDRVIGDYPFSMVARFTRGAILGLVGKELKGLKDLELPEGSGRRCWREWVGRYYRGLLLLKLGRYGDAEKDLVGEFSKAIASGEDQAILRMGAAMWFLSRDDTAAADRCLLEVGNLHDCHAQYLSLVLRLHSATVQADLALMDSLRKQMAAVPVVDDTLERAISALGQKNFSLALTYETNALLKLAA